MGAVVAVVNQKGGVGKTTVTLGLASAGMANGDRILVVDADPQASATWALGVDPESVERGVSEVIDADRAGAARSAIVPSGWGPAVDVLPATRTVQERESDRGRKSARRLARALEGVADEYELVLVDCSPALGQMTVNALASADLALMVVEPAALSARGIAAVSDLIDAVWDEHNRDLDIAGVIVNRVPPVSGEADRQYDLLVRMLGRKTVWRPEIPQRVVIAAALGEQRPLHGMGARGAAAAALFDEHYRRLRAAGRKALRARSAS